jgi:hypothetical protein
MIKLLLEKIMQYKEKWPWSVDAAAALGLGMATGWVRVG